MSIKVLNKRSKDVLEDGSPKLPTSEQLEYGELAFNYAPGVETMSIKNSDDEVVSVLINGMMQTIGESLARHESRNDNPHGVTKEQVGLEKVDNTADKDKPVSTPQQEALDKKLDNAANGGIANDLTTNRSDKALSAAQGIVLSKKIDTLTGGAASDLKKLEDRVASVEEEIKGSIEYIDNTLMPRAKEVHAELTI